MNPLTRIHVDCALRLARRSARILKKHFRQLEVVQRKQDATPVTIADRTVNDLVLKTLRRAFPMDTIITEEANIVQGKSHNAWVADPLDGTIPYSLGIPTFTFSLAYVVDGRPVFGVIIDPILNTEYTAQRGRGAQRNGRALGRAAAQAVLHGAITTEGTVDDALYPVYRRLHKKYWHLALACITFPSMLVASGTISATIFPYSGPWDIAAVKVIVEEAGGIVRNLHGREQRYDRPIDGAIIANRHVYRDILKTIQPALVKHHAARAKR